jgi:histidinol dehydrogenase
MRLYHTPCTPPYAHCTNAVRTLQAIAVANQLAPEHLEVMTEGTTNGLNY